MIVIRARHVYDGEHALAPSIRKVHAVAAGAIFDPGLKVNCQRADLDELSEQAPFWGLEQIQLGAGRFRGSIRGVHSARVQIGCTRRNLGVAILGAIPANSVVLGCIARQADEFIVRGEKVSAHELVKLSPEQEVDCRALGSLNIMTVALDANFFERGVEATLGTAALGNSRRLEFFNGRARMALIRKLQALLNEGYDSPHTLQHAELANVWEDQVLDACLADLSGAANSTPFNVRFRAARRAEELLMSLPNRPVSIVELCQATGVAKRTLMLGFRETYGMSPHNYHQRLRLNHARRELRADSHYTIAQIALRWGFNHLGRFSEYYQRQFGELPTVHRRSKYLQSPHEERVS